MPVIVIDSMIFSFVVIYINFPSKLTPKLNLCTSLSLSENENHSQ